MEDGIRVDSGEELHRGTSGTQEWWRAVGLLLGVCVLGTGLYFAVEVFMMVGRVLRNPEWSGTRLEQWRETVGGDQLDILVAGSTYSLDAIVALLVAGAGVLLMAWIPTTMMRVGAKLLEVTLSEKAAVKRLLAHVVGVRGSQRSAPRS